MQTHSRSGCLAGVTAVQRFGGAINLNVHFHTLVPGVFDVSGEGRARFQPLPAPRDEEVSRILEKVIRKVARHLDARAVPEGDAAQDALAALQARAVDRRFRLPDPFKLARRSASLDGYSLHAGVRIHENDRERRERLCRAARTFRAEYHEDSQRANPLLSCRRMPRPRSLLIGRDAGRAEQTRLPSHPDLIHPRVQLRGTQYAPVLLPCRVTLRCC